MIKAIIFDFFGVLLVENGGPNRPLLNFIGRNLKTKYKIGVLTNAGKNYIEEIFDDLDKSLFEVVVMTYSEGLAKPQPEAYALAADRLGVKPEQCIFVDDTKGHCEGAEKAGMKAVHYRDFDRFIAELQRQLKPVSDN